MAAAGTLQAGGNEEQYQQLQLPSLSAAWFLEDQQGSSPEVRDTENAVMPPPLLSILLAFTVFCSSVQVEAVSRRILALQQLLGGGGVGGVDVVWMVVREPRLLSADFRRWAWPARLLACVGIVRLPI